MTADDLIAALSELTPDQRRLDVLSHDGFGGTGDVVAVEQVEVEGPFDGEEHERPERPALHLRVTELTTFEWIRSPR